MIEFPLVNNLNASNTNNPQNMIEETYEASPLLQKENFKMINRIKSSSNPRIKSMNPKPMSLSEKETNILEENTKLRSEVQRLKSELSQTKKEILQLDSEIDKKEKIIEELISDTQVNNQAAYLNPGTGQKNPQILSKVNETKLVMNLKKQFKDLRRDYTKKCDEIDEMKKLIKFSKLNELSIENKTLFTELTKIKNFYEISLQQNHKNDMILKEYENLQENFSKQQFLIISLQESNGKQKEEMTKLSSENDKHKATIAERNKKIAELKRNLKVQVDYANRLMNVRENQEYIQMKEDLERKVASLRRDLAYYKDNSEKYSKMAKKYEGDLKAARQSSKDGNKAAVEGNGHAVADSPEDNIDVRIGIYKSKLNELALENKKLRQESQEMRARLKNKHGDLAFEQPQSTEEQAKSEVENIQAEPDIVVNTINSQIPQESNLSNTRLRAENTNLSGNLLKENELELDITTEEISKISPINDETFNELIYILMKNFEANKIDSSVIESSFPVDLTEPAAKITKSLVKNLLYLLKK